MRRGARAAIVMPGLFAICVKVIGNATIASFAAFGAVSLTMLVGFTGPTRTRLQNQAAVSVAGGALVCLGTLASRATWLAVVAMAVVAFVVVFAGVVSSATASATTALLLAFILPVSLPAPLSDTGDRLAGWGLASGAAFLAVAFLWPAPARTPLRSPAAAACRQIARRLRADVAAWMTPSVQADEEKAAAGAAAAEAVGRLHEGFVSSPWRPTGITTSARTIVRLVDELLWMGAVAAEISRPPPRLPVDRTACRIRSAAAAVLEHSALLLEDPSAALEPLRAARFELAAATAELDRHATVTLPMKTRAFAGGPRRSAQDSPGEVEETATGEMLRPLDAGFRAQELGFGASRIAANVELAVRADRRSWLDLLTGRDPDAFAGRLRSVRDRSAAHLDPGSVWFHNSVRSALGLGLAVLVAKETDVQHSFWVILGALSVLRSNALNTGQNVLRALLGTIAGFVIAGGILVLTGSDTTVLWSLFPIAVLVAGFAPTAVGFTAGQAGFTVTLVILFNLVQPAGWRVGLVRVEDVAIGCAVSLGVGLSFWPRGAGAALGSALRSAYVESASYVAAAARYGVERARGPSGPELVVAERAAAAAASRRLDDAFRTYLAERGTKPIPLADVTTLVAGVANLRESADAIVDLWERSGDGVGAQPGARREVEMTSTRLRAWYEALGAALGGDGEAPTADQGGDDLVLARAVAGDLRGQDAKAAAAAVRTVWTADHLETLRRFEASLVAPAQAVAATQTARRFGFDFPHAGRGGSVQREPLPETPTLPPGAEGAGGRSGYR